MATTRPLFQRPPTGSPGPRAAAILLALVLGSCMAPAREPGTRAFTRPVELEDSAYTSANVELGDVDGDGWLDLVLVKGRHWPLPNLLLRGDGRGGLLPPEPVGTVADRSYTGLLVDMDGDGDLDLVVSNDQPDPKRIYLNDGTGGFTETARFGAPEWATRHVAAADLDGDGHMDLVAANRSPDGSAESYVCFGDGQGGVVEPCTPVITGSSTTITPADMTGDGAPDLVVPYRDGGQGLVLVNDGSGAFSNRIPFGPGDAAMRTARAADLDRDGILDLVAIDEARGPLVFSGTADGGFGPGRPLPDTDARPYSIHVADLDRNGRPDVIVGYVEARSIVFFNEWEGGWTPVALGDSLGVAYGFATGDVDRDGFLDLAVARSGATNLLWYGTSSDVR